MRESGHARAAPKAEEFLEREWTHPDASPRRPLPKLAASNAAMPRPCRATRPAPEPTQAGRVTQNSLRGGRKRDLGIQAFTWRGRARQGAVEEIAAQGARPPTDVRMPCPSGLTPSNPVQQARLQAGIRKTKPGSDPPSPVANGTGFLGLWWMTLRYVQFATCCGGGAPKPSKEVAAVSLCWGCFYGGTALTGVLGRFTRFTF